MELFEFSEKIDILERNLEKRLKHIPEMLLTLRKEIKIFNDQRQEIVDRIKKYENDEFITKILQNNLDYIDTQYEKDIAERKTELERLEKQTPTIKQLISYLGEVRKYPNTYILLDWFMDLFLARTLHDWVEIEKAQAEQENEEVQKDATA